MTAMAGVSKLGVFRDEKKMEGAHALTSSLQQGCNKSSAVLSSTVRELDLIVREIIGVELFDEHQGDNSIDDIHNNETSSSSSSHHNNNDGETKTEDVANSKLPPQLQPQPGSRHNQPNKKTRQHSPTRKSPPMGLSSALDHILFHGSHSPPSSPSSSPVRNGSKYNERDIDWEKIMWESASILSNSRPSPSFMVHRYDRIRRSEHQQQRGREEAKGASEACNQKTSSNLEAALASSNFEGIAIHDTTNRENSNNAPKDKKSDEEKNNGNTATTPIFEGNVANATPGDIVDGGTGSGTAQHLACLLDSPLALALLVVMGVNLEARHTAFRRLAVHEAACADSPMCLGLLMEVGTRYSRELFQRESRVPPAAAASTASAGDGSVLSFESSAAASLSAQGSGLDALGIAGGEAYLSDAMDERSSSASGGKKASKKKLNLFSGWHKGNKTPGGGGGLNHHGLSPLSSPKKGSSSFDDCENKSPETTSFPTVLRVMWEATKFVRSGLMNEMNAAHYILDRIKVSNRAMMILALQCPHLPPSSDAKKASGGEDNYKAPTAMATLSAPHHPSLSPFASIPGLVNHLFHQPPNHRDMQSSFIKRNVDGHGNTPLHWAAFKNSVAAMDVLLSYNVDVNSRAQPSGWTPLHDAAYSDAAEAVDRLIAAGAVVDARSHSGATPLCFAAQEDAPNATRRLLKAGADPAMRCLGNSPGAVHVRANNADNNTFHSRFSGYTPLHYCAHYNAAKAARVLLYENNHRCQYDHQHLSAEDLLEIPDLNEKLPIHVAVARGSSSVLKELLHGGARVETSCHRASSPRAGASARASRVEGLLGGTTSPMAIPRSDDTAGDEINNNTNDMVQSASPSVITPVSSPILRAMIPSQPITSSKPWNCLSQKSIDACKHLIEEVELNWTPERHTLFAPADRVAVVEVLRVGKRLEQVGRGIFLDLWPHVLSFCGRGWFEPVVAMDAEGELVDGKVSAKNERGYHNDDNNEEEISMQCSTASGNSSEGEDAMDFTQFQLDETNNSTDAIL